MSAEVSGVLRFPFRLAGARGLTVVFLATVVALGSISGCGDTPKTPVLDKPLEKLRPPEKLSAYGLFRGNGSTQEPVEGVIPYDLNSALFSDYTEKFRFVKVPPGRLIEYKPDQVFEFPVGTIIAKTFAYPVDARDPSQGRRLLETRILKREREGWVGLPYIWNAEQTEATLDVAGSLMDVTWTDVEGQERKNNYIIPNSNQCKGCHKQGDEMQPIGPKARNLNRDFAYADVVENQLVHWSKAHALAGAPMPDKAPKVAVWNDPATGTLDERARAWLEINCAHCHNPAGPAKNSGLDLLTTETNPTLFGIFKTPVAAGRGSGNREYDIVPGAPDKSIIMYRIQSTDPGIMMPELGKRLVHAEGVELIREWIAAMPPMTPPSRAR